MSVRGWWQMKKIAIVLIVSFISFLGAQEIDIPEDEDSLIIQALYYEVNNPKEASEIWKKLFEKTNKEEYLVEYFNSALRVKKVKDIIKELQALLAKKKNKDLYELLANLYMTQGNNDNAISILENVKNLDIDSLYQLAYLYTLTHQDDKALGIYKKIYATQKSWEALKGELAILSKRNNIKKIKEILWQEIHNNPALPKEAFLVLAGLLDLKKESNKALYIFKKLFEMTGDKQYLKQMISIYFYQNNFNALIKTLEQTHFDNKLLYELYISKNRFVDAYLLLDSLYQKSKDPYWLGQKAMLTYEITKKYKSLNKAVIEQMDLLFQKAYKEGVKNPTFYNFHGYILIDEDYDIARGIALVQKALKYEPNNIYYLDSLAWGYFKQKNCQKALEIVKKIEKKGVEEKEIINHIKKIKACKE